MLLKLRFVPPDNHPIWQDFIKLYEKNPILLDNQLIAHLAIPSRQTKLNYIGAQQAQQILIHFPKLSTLDMGEFGHGVITTAAITEQAYILPIMGHYCSLNSSLVHSDKVIELTALNHTFPTAKALLHQAGLLSLIQHAPNTNELKNYFELNLIAANEQQLTTENLQFDQNFIADFETQGQRITLPYPLIKTCYAIEANHMLAYCYGDRFWQKQSHYHQNHYFRCFHKQNYQAIELSPIRRAFWFEIDNKPIKPLLINEHQIGKDIELSIGTKQYLISGIKMLQLIQQYPYATMLKLDLSYFTITSS